MNRVHKGILVLAIALFLPRMVSSQTEYAIGKGSFTLGGEASLTSRGGEMYGGERARTIRIAPDVMYFFVPHVALGGSFSLTSSSLGGRSSTAIGFGPAVGVWFGSHDAKLFPYILLSLLLRENQYDEYSSTMATYVASAGVDVMIARNVALTTRLSYQRESYSSEYNGDTASETGNQILLGAGFRAFVY